MLMKAKLIDICKFIVAFVWSFFLHKKDIWIITERKSECKDNGFHLFKYIRSHKPDINVYYAIEKNSDHIKQIEKYGNILAFNSIQHYAYALAAKYLIGAFLPCGIPESFCFYRFENSIIKGKKCFLQHGITKEKIDSLMYQNTGLDLFICGAAPEYDFICNCFGYPINNIKYTGLARFDALNTCSCENRQFILLMPTWRKYLTSQTWGDKDSKFENSQYFNAFEFLISHPRLHAILNENNIDLIFYPHHEIQHKLQCFNCNDRHIILASEKDYDVQDLLKKASLLITDYSSVAFDFAYMNKPLIYYQFDEEEYYKSHYSKGYFDYATMGFGPICKNPINLISLIEKSIQNNFCNSIDYLRRIEFFFPLRDKNNCARIFNSILDNS